MVFASAPDLCATGTCEEFLIELRSNQYGGRRSKKFRDSRSVHSFAREQFPFCIYLIISFMRIYIYIYKKCIVSDELTWFLVWKKKKKKDHWSDDTDSFVHRKFWIRSVLLPWESACRARKLLELRNSLREIHNSLIFPVSRSRRFDFRSGSAIERTSINKNPRNGDPLLPSLRSSLWRSQKSI